MREIDPNFGPEVQIVISSACTGFHILGNKIEFMRRNNWNLDVILFICPEKQDRCFSSEVL
jgi:hypothetical protein